MSLDLDKKLRELAERIGDECKDIKILLNNNKKNLLELTTVEKSNVVSAINELKETLDFLQSTSDNQLGWATAVNIINDVGNPLIINEDEEFTLAVRNDSGLYSQTTDIINSLIDNDTNELLVSNLNDLFFIRIQFKLKTALADREGKLWIDIGNQKFNFEKFSGSSDAESYENVSINMHFYQYLFFQSNKGKIKGILNGSGEIYDISLLIEKKFHGKNL